MRLDAVSFSTFLKLAVSLLCFAGFNSCAFAEDGPAQGSASMPPFAPSISSELLDAQDMTSIAELERRFFYHAFTNEPVEKRLSRLEHLFYGAQRDGSLHKRVSDLMKDLPLESASAVSLGSSSTSSPVDSPGVPEDSSTAGNGSSGQFNPEWKGLSLTQEVATMEKEVFGRTFSSSPLVDRVGRLENAVFAGQAAQTFTPLTTRINRLVSALEPKFSTTQNYFADAPAMSTFKTYQNEGSDGKTDSDKKSSGHPIIHKLGKILGGIGTIAGETIGGVAAGTMMGYGYGYGGYGFGYPFGFPAYYGWGPRPFMGSYW